MSAQYMLGVRVTNPHPHAEKEFIYELQVFRTEADSALQFLYTFLAIHAVLRKDKQALRAVNKTPLFWNTRTYLKIVVLVYLSFYNHTHAATER